MADSTYPPLARRLQIAFILGLTCALLTWADTSTKQLFQGGSCGPDGSVKPAPELGGGRTCSVQPELPPKMNWK